MTLKSKIKKTLFGFASIGFLAPAVVACAPRSNGDINRVGAQEVARFIEEFNALSPNDQPLETTLSDRSKAPETNALTSISDLDNLVAGTPFSDLVERLNLSAYEPLKNMSASVSAISTLGTVRIDLTFKSGNPDLNLADINTSITLQGFIPGDLLVLSEIASKLEAISPQKVLEEFASSKPIGTLLTSLNSLDNLVQGTPFSDALEGIPFEGITIQTAVGEIEPNGEVQLDITFLKGSLSSRSKVVLFGFGVFTQERLQRIRDSIASVSSSTFRLQTSAQDPTQKPSAENLTTLSALDALSEGEKFSDLLGQLPSGVTLSARVGEIALNGDLEITITIARNGLNSLSATIFMKGFIHATQAVLNSLTRALTSVSDPNQPLNTILEDKTQAPNANTLTNLASLDALVQGTPFTTRVGTIDPSITFSTQVNAINDLGQIRVIVTLEKDTLKSQAIIVIGGFVNGEQNDLNQLAEAINQQSSLENRLKVTVPNPQVKPNANNLRTLESLDALVAGTPFVTNAGNFFNNVTMQAEVGDIRLDGSLEIILTLSRPSAQQRQAKVYLTGFLHPSEVILNNLTNQLHEASRPGNPFLTIAQDPSQKPLASTLTSIESLDRLVEGTPFHDRVGTLDPTINMSAEVGNIDPSGNITITVRFVKDGLSKETTIIIGGFQTTIQGLLDVLSARLTKVTEGAPLETTSPNRGVSPDPHTNLVLSDLDNLVAGRPFTDALKSLPQGVTMSSEVSPIDKNGQVTITVTFMRNGITSQAKVLLSGFTPATGLDLANFARIITSISTREMMLQTSLTDLTVKPDASTLNSLTALDSIVVGTPFRDALVLPPSVRVSAEVADIDENGVVQITLTLSEVNSESSQAIIFIGGFQKATQIELNTLSMQINSLSSFNSPRLTDVSDLSTKPNAALITTLSSLDNLVKGQPFSDLIRRFPQGVTMSATVSEIMQNGSVFINLTLMKNNLTAQARVYLTGFNPPSQIDLKRLVVQIGQVSPRERALETTAADKTQKPDQSTLTSLFALDSLVAGSPFSSLITLSPGVTLSAQVAEINDQGIVQIQITLEHPELQAASTFIYIQGFERPAQTIVNNLSTQINTLSSFQQPLRATVLDPTVAPDPLSLRTLSDLDALVANTPFSDLLNVLPDGVEMSAAVSEISDFGLVTIDLTFTKMGLSARGSLFLSGFQAPRRVNLVQIASQVNALSSDQRRLAIADGVPKNFPPGFGQNITISDFDALVPGAPFSNAITGLLDNVTIQATVSPIDLNGNVLIAVRFSHPEQRTTQSRIYLSGFINNTQNVLNRLVEATESVSPSTNPLQTTVANKRVKPDASTLTTIPALDNLVQGRPFLSAVSFLPSGVTMSAQVSEISIENEVTIVLTFSSQGLSESATIVLGGFINQTVQALEDLAANVSRVGALGNNLNLAVFDKNQKPDGSLLTSLAALDNLVEGTPFIDATSNNSLEGVTIRSEVDEINLQGVVRIRVIFSKQGITKESFIFLSGFISQSENDFVRAQNILRGLSSQLRPLATTVEDKTQAPDANSLRTFSDLDALVSGDPFTSTLNTLAAGITFSAQVGEIDNQGNLKISLLLSKSGFQDQIVDLYFNGFINLEFANFRSLVNRVGRLSSPTNRLTVKDELKDAFLDASTLVTFSSLDDLLITNPFRNNSLTLLTGVTLSSEVGEVDNSGFMKIDLTFLKGNDTLKTSLYLRGFNSGKERKLSLIVNKLLEISSVNNPLTTTKSDKTTPPSDSTANSIRNLDDLVAGTPFTDAVSQVINSSLIDFGLLMQWTAGPITIGRQVIISVRITGPGVTRRNFQLALKGFVRPNRDIQDELNRISQAITNQSPQGAPLLTTKADKTQAPKSEDLKTLADLDNLVSGSPFSDIVSGNLPSWISATINASGITTNGEVIINLTLSDALGTGLSTTSNLYLGGFITPQANLESFANRFAEISPSSNPLVTNISDNDLRPTASLLNSIESLDLLVSGTPFKSAIGSLPPNTTMSSKVSRIQNDSTVRITVTFTQNILDAQGNVTSSIRQDALVVISGFISVEEQTNINSIVSKIAEVSTNENTLNTSSSATFQKPNASIIKDLSDLDNLVNNRQFSSATILPFGVTIKATVSEIQLSRKVIITFRLVKGGFESVEGKIFLGGYSLDSRTVHELLLSYINPLNGVTSEGQIIATNWPPNSLAPNSNELNIISDLDRVVVGTPFHDAFPQQPDGTDLQITRDEPLQDGTVIFKVRLTDRHSQRFNEVFLPISGFATPQFILNRFTNSLTAISPDNAPLKTTKIDRAFKPRAETLTSLSRLDNLVEGTPFTSGLSNVLVPGTTMSARVEDITANGEVRIILTFEKNIRDLNGVTSKITSQATIKLSGFIPPTTQSGLDEIIAKLNAVSTEAEPLTILDSIKNRLPDANSLRTIANLDTIVDGFPFTQHVGSLPADIVMRASVSEVDIERKVRITLTLSRRGLITRTAIIVLRGFVISEETERRLAEAYLATLGNLGTLSNPLITNVPFTRTPPSNLNINSYEDIDSFLEGTPIADVLGNVPENFRFVSSTMQNRDTKTVKIQMVLVSEIYVFTGRGTYMRDLYIRGFENLGLRK